MSVNKTREMAKEYVTVTKMETAVGGTQLWPHSCIMECYSRDKGERRDWTNMYVLAHMMCNYNKARYRVN